MVEFPKALYLGDECLIAADSDDEARIRALGYRFWSDAAAPAAPAAAEVPDVPPAPRRGRPPKGAQ
jgi:hypothetical protein